MPSPDTFSIPPISALLDRYLDGRKIVIDPFARNSRRGTLTNDLDPASDAAQHLDAEVFSAQCVEQKIVADAILFDPPYSPRQIMEVYQRIGREVGASDTQNARLGRVIKTLLANTPKSSP